MNEGKMKVTGNKSEKGEILSALPMLYHLYEYPLYQYVDENDKDINVLLVGFGGYGQKFLDACLQVGQMIGKTLNVKVFYGKKSEKTKYLGKRTALKEFFHVKGNKQPKEAYGKIEFYNKNINDGLDENIKNMVDEQKPHYIFVALENDEINRSVAEKFKSYAQSGSCVVNYICECKSEYEKKKGQLHPIYVNEDIKKHKLYKEIERMAFNVHLIWEKDLNFDYEEVRKNFNEVYNHDSCVSNVVSLKYKLHSIGIDYKKKNAVEAAGKFFEFEQDKDNKEQIDKLIWIEHRRWVTEKVCLGWKGRSIEECLKDGQTKDGNGKTHICILRSKSDARPEVIAQKFKTHKWDAISDEELESLDDLDRMSINLHREVAKKADEAKSRDLLSGKAIEIIRSAVENEKRAFVAFQEWYSCLKDIWNNDAGKVCIYRGLKNRFLNEVEKSNLSAEQKNSVSGQIKSFEAEFSPVIASMEYRDWKQDDVALMENIPFILTFTDKSCMVIPYTMGSVNELFKNVAAPTVVNPEKIVYLYQADNAIKVENLKNTIPHIMDYMDKKNLRADVEIILEIPEASSEFEVNVGEIRALCENRIKNVNIVKFNKINKQNVLGVQLKKIGKKYDFITVENRKVGDIPQYTFNSEYMMFEEDLPVLSFIKKTPHITVADMLVLNQSYSGSSNQPEFFDDFESLWNQYKKNPKVWKYFCRILRDNHKYIYWNFNKQVQKSANPAIYNYIIPFYCRSAVEKIIDGLKKSGLLENGSKIINFSSNSCKVTLEDCHKNMNGYNKLFSDFYKLTQPDAIDVYQNNNAVTVKLDTLSTRDIQEQIKDSDEIRNLMNFLKQKGYIFDKPNDNNDNTARKFNYGTKEIKELLTTEGKMLEVYTYHKLKASGMFDDVVSSYEINWKEGTDFKNEFDCIVTKGFKSMFVECKATVEIEDKFYEKINNLTQNFGVNAKAVMVADTDLETAENKNKNKKAIERGALQGVPTIVISELVENNTDLGKALLKEIS